MKELEPKELISIQGGGLSDLGEWLIDGVGDLLCKAKSLYNKASSWLAENSSSLKNYSHGTYPGNL
jgi:hypothetical protein